MRTKLVMTMLAAGALASGGCATKAGTGALVGSATGNAGAGAAIGGALGAGTGAIVGSAADDADREKREIRQASVAAAQAQQARMGMTDVVRMVQEGQSETVIVNQIRSTGSTFQLTSSDLSYLKTQGVPDRVIVEMQNARAAAPVIVSPRQSVIYADPPPPAVVVYERRRPPPPVVFVGGYRRW